MTAAAPTASPATAEVVRARVAVMVATYQVDVVLPTKFSIETFIDDLIGVLAAAIKDESVDFNPPVGQWSLARPGEAPMPRWRTLEEDDVVDGAVLMLSAVESAEVFTPLVEDITDALALTNEREFAEFDAETTARVGVFGLGLISLACAGALSWSWTRTGSLLWCGVPALALALACWIAAIQVRRRGFPPLVCLGFTLSVLPLLFVGGAMLVPPPYDVPGAFGPANLTAGAAFVVAAAVTMLRRTNGGIATLMAVTALAVTATIALLPLVYLHLAVRQVAGGAVLIGLILLTSAPRLAVVIARIRPPDLPDPGNEVSPGTLTDIFETESAQTRAEADGQSDNEPERVREGVGIEQRARLAVISLRGAIAGFAALLSIGTVVAAAASPGGIREIVLAAAVTGLLMLRARWYPDRVQAISLIVGATVTLLGTAWVLVDAYTTPIARMVVVLVVAAAGVAGCVAAIQLPGRRLSPVTRRVIDLFEYALILVVPVIAVWVMGVYTAMRGI
ncbi:type VII secretion integral membrane protein EccD [Nocardia panacis]|nr:type VII secretion integral membrane protein EccD [Nocardia panacis]